MGRFSLTCFLIKLSKFPPLPEINTFPYFNDAASFRPPSARNAALFVFAAVFGFPPASLRHNFWAEPSFSSPLQCPLSSVSGIIFVLRLFSQMSLIPREKSTCKKKEIKSKTMQVLVDGTAALAVVVVSSGFVVVVSEALVVVVLSGFVVVVSLGFVVVVSEAFVVLVAGLGKLLLKK